MSANSATKVRGDRVTFAFHGRQAIRIASLRGYNQITRAIRFTPLGFLRQKSPVGALSRRSRDLKPLLTTGVLIRSWRTSIPSRGTSRARSISGISGSGASRVNGYRAGRRRSPTMPPPTPACESTTKGDTIPTRIAFSCRIAAFSAIQPLTEQNFTV